ncbi:hypothetical protein [Paraburkholderia piptadeniae]
MLRAARSRCDLPIAGTRSDDSVARPRTLSVQPEDRYSVAQHIRLVVE